MLLEPFPVCFLNNNCFWLVGSHTGTIRALGGGGQIENVDGKGASGSGAGGRIAIYHATVRLMSPYRGSYDTEGGAVGSVAEAGAAGTVFLHHVGLDHKTLRIDNKDRSPKVTSNWSLWHIAHLIGLFNSAP